MLARLLLPGVVALSASDLENSRQTIGEVAAKARRRREDAVSAVQPDISAVMFTAFWDNDLWQTFIPAFEETCVY